MIIERLNELEREIEELKVSIAEGCVEEGYPSYGSNYEVRYESFCKPLEKEIDEILDYAELVGIKIKYDCENHMFYEEK